MEGFISAKNTRSNLVKTIIINKNDANQRLDKFLLKSMPKLPKSMLYKGIRKNCVKINGKHIKKGEFVLSEGDTLDLYFKDEFFEKKSFTPISGPVNIVYEDENIMIINKPAGLVVHADDKNTSDTLIDRIKSYLYKKGEYTPEDEHSFSPSLANRLDRNTSGLVIAAKNAESLRILNEKIKNREIRKFYSALVEGCPEKEGRFTAYLTRMEKKVTVSDFPSTDAKEVCTEIYVREKKENSSLLDVELHTGRTHQIRAQLAHMGYPLAGDVKYGAKKTKDGYSLIAYRLMFSFNSNGGILEYLNGKSFCI